MNWKVLAIVLIVVVVLVGAYSLGIFAQDEEVLDDGTAAAAEGLEVSVDIQSDFWDGFGDWLFSNLLWLCGGGLIVWFITSMRKSR